MNKLNVFNNTYYRWRYPSCWWRNIKIFFNSFSAAYQRITRGFCWWDVWDFDTHLAELMAQGLTVLADEGWGYPGDEEFPTKESWEDYLHQIVKLLRFYLDDQYNEYEEDWAATWEDKSFEEGSNHKKSLEEQEITDKFLNRQAEIENEQYAAALKALSMITHVWGNLWD